MHDVNPLGPIMHLKELERRIVTSLPRPSRTKNVMLSRLFPAVLKRLHFGVRPAKAKLRWR